jgi:hypothetical protein
VEWLKVYALSQALVSHTKKFNSKVSYKTQRKLLAVCFCKNFKISHTFCYTVNISIPKRRNKGIRRSNETKSRVKLSSSNIKSYSSMSSIWGTRGRMWATEILGSPTHYCLAHCSSHGPLFRLTSLFAHGLEDILCSLGLSCIFSFTPTASTLPTQGMPAGILILSHIAWPPRSSSEIWVEDSMTP